MNTPPSDYQSADADGDLIWGAENIGREINRSQRQVYHLAARKLIPVEYVGAQLVARRSKLRKIGNGDYLKCGLQITRGRPRQ